MKSTSIVLADAQHRTVSKLTVSVTGATTDIEAVQLWLAKYVDVPSTLSVYRKESERFLFWLADQKLSLQQLKVEHVLVYQAFLLDPQPREKWCLQQQPRYLASGELNPAYKEVKKVSRYLKNGEPNPAWRPFVGGLSQAAQRHAMSILFGLCEFLTTVGYLAANPFRAARKRTPPPAKTVMRYLEKDVLQNAIATLEQWPETTEPEYLHKERTIFVVKFLYLTGLRRAELAALRWEHVRRVRGQYWLQVQGKGQRAGEVPLTSAALEVLNRYRKSLHRGELDHDDVGPVLLDLTGRWGLTPQTVHRIVTEALRGSADTRLQKVSAHWLRHSAASHMLDAGVSLQAVRDNLRHANISTTSSYIHTNRDKRHVETELHSI